MSAKDLEGLVVIGSVYAFMAVAIVAAASNPGFFTF